MDTGISLLYYQYIHACSMLYGLAMAYTWCCRVPYWPNPCVFMLVICYMDLNMACMDLQNGPPLHTNTTGDPQNGPLNFGTGTPYTYIHTYI